MRIKNPGNSRHHLFTYLEVKQRLIDVFGIPDTDEEHIFMQREVVKFRKNMKLYAISEEYHRSLHKKNDFFKF